MAASILKAVYPRIPLKDQRQRVLWLRLRVGVQNSITELANLQQAIWWGPFSFGLQNVAIKCGYWSGKTVSKQRTEHRRRRPPLIARRYQTSETRKSRLQINNGEVRWRWNVRYAWPNRCALLWIKSWGRWRRNVQSWLFVLDFLWKKE